MTPAPAPAGAETLSAFCFAPPCRARREWTRVLDSAPVFKCAGCGGTREFQELGRGAGEIPPAAAPREQGAARNAGVPPVERIVDLAKRRGPGRKTPRPQEKPMKKPVKTKPTPLQAALESAARHAALALEERMAALEKAMKSQTPPDEKALRVLIEEVIDKVIQRSVTSLVYEELLRQLGASSTRPAKHPRAPGHKHRGACGAKCFGEGN